MVQKEFFLSLLNIYRGMNNGMEFKCAYQPGKPDSLVILRPLTEDFKTYIKNLKQTNFVPLSQMEIMNNYRGLHQAMLSVQTDIQTLIDGFCQIAHWRFPHYSKQQIKKEIQKYTYKTGQLVLDPQKTIKYYTKVETFYSTLNFILRALKDPTQVFYCQPFYKCIYQKVKQLYKSQEGIKEKEIKYRGSTMSSQQIQNINRQLQQNGNEMIVLSNGFLSTSKLENIAITFEVNVLYQIQIHPHIKRNRRYDVGYASIQSLSQYDQEKQVLFNPFSSFILTQKPKKGENYYYKLTYGFIAQQQYKRIQNIQSAGAHDSKLYSFLNDAYTKMYANSQYWAIFQTIFQQKQLCQKAIANHIAYLDLLDKIFVKQTFPYRQYYKIQILTDRIRVQLLQQNIQSITQQMLRQLEQSIYGFEKINYYHQFYAIHYISIYYLLSGDYTKAQQFLQFTIKKNQIWQKLQIYYKNPNYVDLFICNITCIALLQITYILQQNQFMSKFLTHKFAGFMKQHSKDQDHPFTRMLKIGQKLLNGESFQASGELTMMGYIFRKLSGLSVVREAINKCKQYEQSQKFEEGLKFCQKIIKDNLQNLDTNKLAYYHCLYKMKKYHLMFGYQFKQQIIERYKKMVNKKSQHKNKLKQKLNNFLQGEGSESQITQEKSIQSILKLVSFYKSFTQQNEQERNIQQQDQQHTQNQEQQQGQTLSQQLKSIAELSSNLKFN